MLSVDRESLNKTPPQNLGLMLLLKLLLLYFSYKCCETVEMC